MPSLNQVGSNQTNGSFNATAITDASGSAVETATYVPTNPGLDLFVRNNMAVINLLVRLIQLLHMQQVEPLSHSEK